MAARESPASAVTAHLLTSYRKTWRGSAFNSFIFPVCLLVGIGWSVGRAVHHNIGPFPYLPYVAAGLLAAAVTQVAAAESAWQVFGCFEWSKMYYAVRVTPVRVTDILIGHLYYVWLRALLAGVGFLVVIAVFGVPRSWWTLADLPITLLLAAAVSAPVFAISASIRHAGIYDIVFRLGIVPMSLLSGIYFPLGELPAAVRVITVILPLSHGVGLVRMCTLGGLRAGPAAVDLACLAAWASGGLALARGAFIRRLSD